MELKIKNLRYRQDDLDRVNLMLLDINQEITSLLSHSFNKKYREAYPYNRIFFGLPAIARYLCKNFDVGLHLFERIYPEGMEIVEIGCMLNDLVLENEIDFSDKDVKRAKIFECWQPKIDWLNKIKEHIIEEIKRPDEPTKPCLFNAVGNPNGIGELKAICIVCGADGMNNCKMTSKNDVVDSVNIKSIAVNAKVQFYALYLYRVVGGKYVLTTEHLNDIWKNNLVEPLDLKDLKDVTDEDIKQLAKSCGNIDYDNLKYHFKICNHSNISRWLASSYVDGLRLLGYALDWNGISVKEQIDLGWVRLTSNNIEK